MMMKPVNLIFRKPYRSAYSIEYLFHNLYEEVKVDCPVSKHELPNYSTGFGNMLRNIAYMFRFRQSVVHITGDVYYAILGALFSKRVITIHDLSFLHRTTGFKRSVLKLLWVRLPVLFSHRITVVSEATKQNLLQEVKVDSGKVRVIYNFIDPVYQPVERSFCAHRPHILQVGCDFNKNIVRLAQALKGFPCTLTIVGKLRDEQKAALQEAGIDYTNKSGLSIEELYQEYRKADLLTFVSTIEGFGMPILEAQATGLPVVTSNCSSMPEVAGGGAMLVDPLDVASIRKGIETLVQQPQARAKVVEKGYANVGRFSRAVVASEYCRLYSELGN